MGPPERLMSVSGGLPGCRGRARPAVPHGRGRSGVLVASDVLREARAGDSYAERVEDLRRGVRDLAEDLEDLREPVLEFVQEPPQIECNEDAAGESTDE